MMVVIIGMKSVVFQFNNMRKFFVSLLFVSLFLPFWDKGERRSEGGR